MNTDDYEGHTPGPWRTAEGQPYDDEGSHLDIVDANGVLVTETSYFTDNDHPNTQLIADAPLLLAEVEQLQVWKAKAKQTLDGMLGLFEYFALGNADIECDNPWATLYFEIKELIE